MMTANAFVRARIDEHLKDEAETILNYFGLTVSDAVRMTLTRIAHDKALPFELKVPNAETLAAMEEARKMMAARQARFQNGQNLIDALEAKSR